MIMDITTAIVVVASLTIAEAIIIFACVRREKKKYEEAEELVDPILEDVELQEIEDDISKLL